MATFIHVAQETTFDGKSIPVDEILLNTGIKLDFVGVWFASGVNTAHYSSDFRVRALLVEPVGLLLVAIGVKNGARERYGAISKLRRQNLVDCVAFETRQHVVNRVLCFFNVLDDDRVFEQRCNLAGLPWPTIASLSDFIIGEGLKERRLRHNFGRAIQ